MEDILKTLRKLCYSHTHSTRRTCHIAEAADEIERLREELEASRAATRGWIDMLGGMEKRNG